MKYEKERASDPDMGALLMGRESLPGRPRGRVPALESIPQE